MKVLFSTTAGTGHFGPLVPFAQACRDAGHEVRVAAPECFAAAVSAAGLDHAPFADVPPEVLGPIFESLFSMPVEEADRTVVGQVFGRIDAQAALPGLMDLMAGWQPDIVVREFCEFASLVAAAKAGVPQAEVAIGIAAAYRSAMPVLASPLAELDAIAGLTEGTACEMLSSVPLLSCVPVEVDGENEMDASRVRRFRDASLAAVEGSLPPEWGDQDHPLVYATFGSVAGGLPPFAPIYRSVLDALADEPVRVLLTTGGGIDPASLAPFPANAHVERWWPQASLMANAAVVVGHGGFGTTMAALAGGVPQVVIPLFAFDQFLNGARMAAIGAGTCLDGGVGAVPELAPALAKVLGDPSYKAKAAGVAAAMAALPDVATSVPFLEQLAEG